MTAPSLPQPLSTDALFARLESYRARDVDWRAGRAFAYVFHAGREAEEVAKRAYMMFLSENALDPTAFPSLPRLENELVAMVARHLGGGPDTVGSFTSGGTESILLAVKAARDLARAQRPEVTRPTIVLPLSAHAAFHKAAHYLGLEVVQTALDPVTLAADPEALAAAITADTVLVVASAPSYAHGVIDPIEEIGRIALARGVPFHVDACVGGFLLPYFARAGAEVPPFDLSVPGVTSISVDLHKYAFAPKGASLVLYADEALRRAQLYACARWTGYGVVNPTVQSTKSGGPLAGAWAVLHHLGDPGYAEIARALLAGTRRLIAEVEAIPELRIVGRPGMSLIAFASDELDVFAVADLMSERGWFVQPQLPIGGCPASVHLTIGPNNLPHLEALLADLRASVAEVRAAPAPALPPEALAALGQLDLEALGPEAVGALLGMVGAEPGALPARMAPIHHALGALPPPVRERLLCEFVSMLLRPTPAAVGASA